MQIEISSGDLEIRPMTKKDLRFFLRVRNKCVRFLHDNRKFTFKDAQKWFSKTPNKYYIIEYKAKKAGYLRTSDWSMRNKNVCIGCDIDPKLRRKGIATNAYKIFMEYLFKKKAFHKVWLEVIETNQRAIGLYRKLGFKEEGRRKEHLKRGNKYIDSIIMSLLAQDFKDR